MPQEQEFDLTLARECACVFSKSTALGCVVSDMHNNILYHTGYSCATCQMCSKAEIKKERCVQAQMYGMTEAERFGGKYIYFCPMGLTCFVSPIVGTQGSAAKITVGPFLMVDRQDYITCDLVELLQLPPRQLSAAVAELANVPMVETENVNQLSTLLFMAVGFINNVSVTNRMLEVQSSDAIQGQITSYIMQLKGIAGTPPYPFDTEHSLLHAIAQSDKQKAQCLLNELFGNIFFTHSGDLEQAKSRIYELLVLISRAAIDAGADPDGTLKLSHAYLQSLAKLHDVDALCFWLTGVMDRFMDSVFNFTDAKHANIIHQSVQYLNSHYQEHITLEDMAGRVYLSAAYFSRVFKKETGKTFTGYLNHVRIEHSKELLLHQNLRLTDISLLVGFEDQSYFTKVFKKAVGVAPLKYRETKGAKMSK